MLPCLFVFFGLCYISALSFLVCSITNVSSMLDATNRSSLIFCVAILGCLPNFLQHIDLLSSSVLHHQVICKTFGYT